MAFYSRVCSLLITVEIASLNLIFHIIITVDKLKRIWKYLSEIQSQFNQFETVKRQCRKSLKPIA